MQMFPFTDMRLAFPLTSFRIKNGPNDVPKTLLLFIVLFTPRHMVETLDNRVACYAGSRHLNQPDGMPRPRDFETFFLFKSSSCLCRLFTIWNQFTGLSARFRFVLVSALWTERERELVLLSLGLGLREIPQWR